MRFSAIPKATGSREQRPLDLEQLAREFRQKYGRDMTAAEKRFHQLTKDLLDDPKVAERATWRYRSSQNGRW